MRFSCGQRARLILLASLGFGVGVAGAGLGAHWGGTEDLSLLADRLHALQQDRAEVQQKLRGVKQRQRRVTRELATIDTRLDRAEERLHQVSLRASQAQADLHQASRECEAVEARLASHQDSVAERLVAIYQRAETRPIEVLLESTSFADFANRLYLLNQVISRDAELLDEFEEARTRADAQRAALEARARDLAGLQEQVAGEQRHIESEREATAREKRRLLRDRAAWERALAELEEDSREVEAMLQRLQRAGGPKTGLPQQWTGQLRWPVAGRIVSGFGYRTHPIYRVRKMHTGIDLPAASGTPIRAAAGGKVVHAGRWGGYGNCVIVDHNGRFATLYAHCSGIAAGVGQAVEAGEIIGYVGSTGLSTGPHLHFEVRRDGHPVDPEPFL